MEEKKNHQLHNRAPENTFKNNDEGTLAIDLGSSTTVIVFQKEHEKHHKLLDLPPISRSPGEIPSFVWQSPENKDNFLIGQQILDLKLIEEENKNNLSQDFKRWIGSPSIDNIYNSIIPPEKAGEILIHKIWEEVSAKVNVKRLVLTAPVDTYREYRTWLVNACSSLRVKEIALVDEPTAAAMGAGLAPGSTLLVLDFGGSTIDMSIVALEGGEGSASPIAQLVRFDGNTLEGKSSQVLRTAKVLGKAGLRLGGKDIDRWIVDHLLPEEIPTNIILSVAEELKCELSKMDIKETMVISKKVKVNQEEKFLTLSKKGLEELLLEKGLLKSIENLFTKTINTAKRNSFRMEDLNSIVLVGGGSQIPIIKKFLSRLCESVPFITPPPVEAIAIGALMLTPGVQVKDVLNKGISLKCWNKKNEKHIWHPLFLAGQPWPTNKPLEIILAASTINQESIDLIIGEPEEKGSNEIIFINGLPTIEEIKSEERIKQVSNTIISIPLEPPGEIGEDCIKLRFSINDLCQLEIEGNDLRTSSLITNQNLGPIR